MKIAGISGSIRANSLNSSLLNSSAEFLPADVEFEVLKLNNIALYDEDLENAEKPTAVIELLDKITKADVLLFVSPEYNHGMSGVLKNAIDWASRPAFQSPLLNKPYGILTASKSPVGGARAQTDIKNVLSSTLSVLYPANEYLLSNAHEKFDENGKLVDTQATRRLQRYIKGLVAWAKTNNSLN